MNLCRDAEASGSLDPDCTQCVWTLRSLATTKNLGQHLAGHLPAGSILLLKGQLLLAQRIYRVGNLLLHRLLQLILTLEIGIFRQLQLNLDKKSKQY